MDYHPGEVTRTDYYLLPSLPGSFFTKENFETVFLKLVRGQRVRLLDLGCGAGTWLEDHAYVPGTDVIGISARDYRRREDRPEIIFLGYDRSTGEPMYQDGKAILFGESYARSVDLSDSQYLVGDAHDIFPNLPSSYFNLITSYQACRYLFDPLSVLREIQRTLTPGGYAFLESFQPVIVYPNGKNVDPKVIERYLLRQGHHVSYGPYSPDGAHDKFGLALKKTGRPDLSLPTRPAGTITTDTISKLQSETIVYVWEN